MMMGDVHFLSSMSQYREARRVLMSLGFAERSACSAYRFESCILVAPDGYTLKLAVNEPAPEGDE
jgi:hypothetical protein